jgi:hypothetical protein
MATLKKFTVVDPTARLNFTLKLSTRRAIEEYRQYYSTSLAVGHTVERGELVEQMLSAWVEQDATFQKFKAGMSAEQRAEVEKALGGQGDA